MEKIKSMIIIEMVGRPVEHLKEVMKQLLEKLGSEKGVKISNKKMHSPKVIAAKDKENKPIKIPKKQELFSTFAEIEIEAEHIMDLIKIVFLYMPSHVEILSPDDLKLQNFDITAVLSEITKKLHQYDAIAKNALLQNQALARRIEELIAEKRNKIIPAITFGNVGEIKEKPENKKKSKKKN